MYQHIRAGSKGILRRLQQVRKAHMCLFFGLYRRRTAEQRKHLRIVRIPRSTRQIELSAIFAQRAA